MFGRVARRSANCAFCPGKWAKCNISGSDNSTILKPCVVQNICDKSRRSGGDLRVLRVQMRARGQRHPVLTDRIKTTERCGKFGTVLTRNRSTRCVQFQKCRRKVENRGAVQQGAAVPRRFPRRVATLGHKAAANHASACHAIPMIHLAHGIGQINPGLRPRHLPQTAPGVPKTAPGDVLLDRCGTSGVARGKDQDVELPCRPRRRESIQNQAVFAVMR